MMAAASTPGWAKIKAAASYAGVGKRTLRKWLKLGLRSIKSPTGAILIKYDWIDFYLEGFEVQNDRAELDELVDSALEGLV